MVSPRSRTLTIIASSFNLHKQKMSNFNTNIAAEPGNEDLLFCPLLQLEQLCQRYTSNGEPLSTREGEVSAGDIADYVLL